MAKPGGGGKSYAPAAPGTAGPEVPAATGLPEVATSNADRLAELGLAGRGDPGRCLGSEDGSHGDRVDGATAAVGGLFSAMREAVDHITADLAGDADIQYVPEVFRWAFYYAMLDGSGLLATAAGDAALAAIGGTAALGAVAGAPVATAVAAVALGGALKGLVSSQLKNPLDDAAKWTARRTAATALPEFLAGHREAISDVEIPARNRARTAFGQLSDDQLCRVAVELYWRRDAVREGYYARLAAAWLEYKGRVATGISGAAADRAFDLHAASPLTEEAPDLGIDHGAMVQAEVVIVDRAEPSAPQAAVGPGDSDGRWIDTDANGDGLNGCRVEAPRVTPPQLPGPILQRIAFRPLAKTGLPIHYSGAGFEFDTDGTGRVFGLSAVDHGGELLRRLGGGGHARTDTAWDEAQRRTGAILVAETAVRSHSLAELGAV